MARILVTWQLGGGLGHLVPLWPLVRGLCERGHRVFAALKDLSRAGAVFGRIGVSYLQAPFRLGRVDSHIERPRTFAQILHNVAFGDVEELRTLGEAWRNLYDYVQPDLILFDHSPTEAAALRDVTPTSTPDIRFRKHCGELRSLPRDRRVITIN